MSYNEIVDAMRTLSIQQRKALILQTVESLISSPGKEKLHSALEFEGVGADLQDDIDPQGYIRELRKEWDHRP